MLTSLSLSCRKRSWYLFICLLLQVSAQACNIRGQVLTIALTVVHTACQARGQDPKIALKSKDLVLENDNVEVLRVVTRSLSGGLYTKSIIE